MPLKDFYRFFLLLVVSPSVCLYVDLSINLQGGPKESSGCDLEEKCLLNSKIFFDGVFLSIYLHLQEDRASFLSYVEKKLWGSKNPENGLFLAS